VKHSSEPLACFHPPHPAARCLDPHVNPLMGTLKPQSNGQLYSNTVIGTLAVDGWSVIFRTARRGLVGRAAVPPSPLLAVPKNHGKWWRNFEAKTSKIKVMRSRNQHDLFFLEI